MFDAQRWSKLLDGSDCPLCKSNRVPEAEEPRLAATLASGRVLLQNDLHFRGYCILVHQRHVTELYDLSAAERTQFIEDVDRIARALRDQCRPAKINYVVLGNECPHLHTHIIPRYPTDGWWGQPIWRRPDAEKKPLSAEDFAALRQGLETALRV